MCNKLNIIYIMQLESGKECKSQIVTASSLLPLNPVKYIYTYSQTPRLRDPPICYYAVFEGQIFPPDPLQSH